MADHHEAAEVILETLDFLLEHSKSSEHEAIKQRAQEFSDMFDQLADMEGTYVSNMEASLPLWVQFNQHKQELSSWLVGAEQLYASEHLQSGDADVTEQSLKNARVSHHCSYNPLLSFSLVGLCYVIFLFPPGTVW